MSTKEIIRGIKKLPFTQRLRIIEKALKTLHESTDSQLSKGAKALLADYENDKNLTAFTAIDFEKFYETR